MNGKPSWMKDLEERAKSEQKLEIDMELQWTLQEKYGRLEARVREYFDTHG